MKQILIAWADVAKKVVSTWDAIYGIVLCLLIAWVIISAQKEKTIKEMAKSLTENSKTLAEFSGYMKLIAMNIGKINGNDKKDIE